MPEPYVELLIDGVENAPTWKALEACIDWVKAIGM